MCSASTPKKKNIIIIIHRGRTGVQLKDKWRNLIKFQHLRRGEAESAPYKSGARGPSSASKRKKNNDGEGNDG